MFVIDCRCCRVFFVAPVVRHLLCLGVPCCWMLIVLWCVLLVVVFCLFVLGGVVRVRVARCVALLFVDDCCFSLLIVCCELSSFVGCCLSLMLFAIDCCWLLYVVYCSLCGCQLWSCSSLFALGVCVAFACGCCRVYSVMLSRVVLSFDVWWLICCFSFVVLCCCRCALVLLVVCRVLSVCCCLLYAVSMCS